MSIQKKLANTLTSVMLGVVMVLVVFWIVYLVLR